MTIENLVEMLQELKIPFAYDHFAEGESPEPPFICYLITGSDNFAADGRVYFKLNEVRIENVHRFQGCCLGVETGGCLGQTRDFL